MSVQPGVSPQPRKGPRLAVRLLLSAGGLMTGLLLAELLLAVLDRPHFYRPHTFPKQFDFLQAQHSGFPLYVNARSSRIRFEYDGNPRGYFGPDNEVEHITNSLGFRGPEFDLSWHDGKVQADKPPGTVRLVFLGDSFTFGEGVRDEDTYPARTAAILQEHYPSPPPRFESYNLGVGGYNTTASLVLLEMLGLKALPDCVVLGYVLNDAEPPLFRRDPVSGQPYRATRTVEEGAGDTLPPDTWLYRLRLARAIWQVSVNRDLSRRTVEHYRALYDEMSPGWQESRRALKRFIELGAEARVPCYVILFPVLYELNDRYPFRGIHAQVRAEVEGSWAGFIDLLPLLEGQRAEDLWAHPADHHPNEKVHRMAAEALAARLLERPDWPPHPDSATKSSARRRSR